MSKKEKKAPVSYDEWQHRSIPRKMFDWVKYKVERVIWFVLNWLYERLSGHLMSGVTVGELWVRRETTGTAEDKIVIKELQHKPYFTVTFLDLQGGSHTEDVGQVYERYYPE